MAKKRNFPNLDSLAPISRLLREAKAASDDPSRTIETSPMGDVIGAAAGAGTGAGLSYLALYTLGEAGLSAVGITTGLAAAGSFVGGGAVAGMFVLAAPIALCSLLGYGIVKAHNDEKLAQTQQALLQDLLKKHDQLLRELKGRIELTDKRADYLRGLVIALKAALNDLHRDLHGKAYPFSDSDEVPTRHPKPAGPSERAARRGPRRRYRRG